MGLIEWVACFRYSAFLCNIKGTLIELTGFGVVPLNADTFGQSPQEISAAVVGESLRAACGRVGAAELREVLDSDPVEAGCFSVGGERVGRFCCQRGIVDDLLGRTAASNEVIGDHGGAFLFVAGIEL